MQPLIWYVRRLRGMGPAELAWRVRGALRDHVDRGRLALGAYPRPPVPADVPPPFRAFAAAVGGWVSAHDDIEARWRDELRDQAGRIAAHRLSFFHLQDHHLGDPIDWHRDHASGRASPRSFAPDIDYRDFRVAGDAKLVWEPNRHHHLVVLARAYRATGELRFAEALVEQLESWLEACPFGRGMAWRSPLELAIRVINWVFAIDAIRESGLVAGRFRERWLESAWLHLWEITRKYSRASSANNHLIGEAAGVFVGASYFAAFPEAAGWLAESRFFLEREVLAQTYPDGVNREQAFGYHLFVLEFLLVAGAVARKTGRDFGTRYWSTVESMLAYAGALSDGGPAPFYGDADDGYVLDLGGGHGDPRPFLCMGAVLTGRRDFRTWAGKFSQAAHWLLGRGAAERFAALPEAPDGEPLESLAFADSGFYLLQSGHRGSTDRISVVFDCGELGFGSIAAHGHADALSFTLRAFGDEILVDCGTYDYFTFPEWRNYFRATRAHNTVEVDGLDQSVMLGPFLWGQRARARCLRFAPDAGGGIVVGEHDGYARLADPVVHRRTLRLDGGARTLIVEDELLAAGPHQLASRFHLAESCRVVDQARNVFTIEAPGGRAQIEIDPRLELETLASRESPIAGWVSRGYHRREPSVTLVGRAAIEGNATFISHIRISPAIRPG